MLCECQKLLSTGQHDWRRDRFGAEDSTHEHQAQARPTPKIPGAVQRVNLEYFVWGGSYVLSLMKDNQTMVGGHHLCFDSKFFAAWWATDEWPCLRLSRAFQHQQLQQISTVHKIGDAVNSQSFFICMWDEWHLIGTTIPPSSDSTIMATWTANGCVTDVAAAPSWEKTVEAVLPFGSLHLVCQLRRCPTQRPSFHGFLVSTPSLMGLISQDSTRNTWKTHHQQKPTSVNVTLLVFVLVEIGVSRNLSFETATSCFKLFVDPRHWASDILDGFDFLRLQLLQSQAIRLWHAGAWPIPHILQ